MERNNTIKFKLIEGVPNALELESLVELYQNIFEDARIGFFKERINTKENVLSVIAFNESNLIGFKLGYKYDENTMYSWVGGVLPAYRRQSIAKELAKLQEEWAKNKGYSKLRTKSMNRFKPMMILNLKNGFDIKKVYTNDSGQTKIVFEKEIQNNQSF